MKTHILSPFATRAQQWIRWGLKIFPCWPNSKRPCINEWQKYASSDPEVIAEWSKKWPDANIGLLTGTEMIAFDFDSNEWIKENAELFTLLMDKAGMVNQTPRGLYHIGFRNNPAWGFKPCAGILPGVDIRVNNSYIIVPDSYFEPNEEELAKGKKAGSYRNIVVPDSAPDKWNYPPQAFLDQLLKLSKSKDKLPSKPTVSTMQPTGIVPVGEGLRHEALVQECGKKAFAFSNPDDAYEYMLYWCERNMEEALPKAEVMKTVYSMEWRGSPFKGPMDDERLQFNFKILTDQELDEGDFPIDFLVEDVLVKGQPCIIAAPKKAMKTTISVDLALSLTSGTAFLDFFTVNGKYRVGIMSAESGMGTLQETARRIRKSKGIGYQPLFWCAEVPHLDNERHVAALERFVVESKLDVIIFDPAYLMMCGLGEGAANIFKVAQFLNVITELCVRTGVTPIINHHTNSSGNAFEPLELDSMAWAGFQEWARQWILLSRRERYNPDYPGVHKLWMVTGGSAGHTGQVGVDIEEGSIKDTFGRKWEVTIEKSSNIYQDNQDRKDSAKAEGKRLKEEANAKDACSKIYNYLLANGADTKSKISSGAGLNASRVGPAITAMLLNNRIEKVKVEKNGKEHDGFGIRTNF